MISDLNMQFSALFDGCMLGVVSKAPKTLGQKIRKPWRVVSTSKTLTDVLSTFVCTGDHLHAPCVGMDTLKTGFYTEDLARAIIQGLLGNSISIPGATALQTGAEFPTPFDDGNDDVQHFITPRMLKHSRKQAAKQAEALQKQTEKMKVAQIMADLIFSSPPTNTKTGSSKFAKASTKRDVQQQEHRPRINNTPLGLVARLITRKDPEYNSIKVEIAMKKQISTLFANGVWELIPREWNEVKTKARATGEEVVMGRCHHIVSIKHSERDEAFWEYKVRGVFGGHNVRDENGAQKFYEDNGSCPAGIGSARTAVAYAAAVDGIVEAADAEAAYIQSVLTGPSTFCILPPEWISYMPADVQSKAAGMFNPVFKMIKSLYGHPTAGKCWEDHLTSILVGLGWAPLEGMKSCYIHLRSGSKDGPVYLCVYVDDFIHGRKAAKTPMGQTS